MPSPSQALTDKEVGTYLVYRFKLKELIHLHFLFHHLGSGERISGLDADLVKESLRSPAMAWFATIVDPSSLNIFDLWRKMYPQYEKRISIVYAVVKPHLEVIRKFRNRSAFHARPSFIQFLEPQVELGKRSREVVGGLQVFLRLAAFLVRREHVVVPDLSSRMLGVILDAELALSCSINRLRLIRANVLDHEGVFGNWSF